MTNMPKMERRRAEMEAIQRKLAVDSTLEWIDSIIRNHEAGARELKRYRDRFVESVEKPDGMATPVNVVSWLVNEVNNIARNDRLDMAVNHGAALALTAPKKP